MKSRLLILVSLLVMVLTLATAPVSAANTGTAAVVGNPAAYVAITLNQSSIYLPLDPTTSPATNNSLSMTITANQRFQITVADNTLRSAKLGYMGNYTTSYVSSPDNTTLVNPLAMAGTTNGTTVAQTITPPVTTAVNLYLGTPVNNQLLVSNSFSQPVTYTDVVLPTGSTYRIDLLYTIQVY